MALLPPSVGYTSKDFDALRVRLMGLLQSVSPGWSDFSAPSFGNLLLEMYALVGDVLTFYPDNQAVEFRLVTATQRNNVIALARMRGYKLHGARAATAERSPSRWRDHPRRTWSFRPVPLGTSTLGTRWS